MGNLEFIGRVDDQVKIRAIGLNWAKSPLLWKSIPKSKKPQ